MREARLSPQFPNDRWFHYWFRSKIPLSLSSRPPQNQRLSAFDSCWSVAMFISRAWWSDLSSLAAVIVGKKRFPDTISELYSRKSASIDRQGVCVCGWEGFEINVAVVLIDGEAKLANFDFFFLLWKLWLWWLQWLLVQSQAPAVYLSVSNLLWQVAASVNKCMYSVFVQRDRNQLMHSAFSSQGRNVKMYTNQKQAVL